MTQEILFLDEPTLGLDPQSRRAIWEYIAQLKEKKTILLTTHYLEEGDALSDRIAIIDEGKIVALSTPEELKRSISDKQIIVISAKNLTPEILEELRSRYPEVEQRDEELLISAKELNLKEITDYLSSQDAVIYSATLKQPTLDDVFFHLTGKEIRE